MQIRIILSIFTIVFISTTVFSAGELKEYSVKSGGFKISINQSENSQIIHLSGTVERFNDYGRVTCA